MSTPADYARESLNSYLSIRPLADDEEALLSAQSGRIATATIWRRGEVVRELARAETDGKRHAYLALAEKLEGMTREALVKS